MEQNVQNPIVLTKDMLISDIIRKKPRTIQVLMNMGLGCIGCPSSLMESLEQAAYVHGLDADVLLEKLNEA